MPAVMMDAPWPVLLTIRALSTGGGSERQVVEVARFLDRSRFVPHVAYMVDDDRKQTLTDAGVRVVKIPVTSFRGPSAWRGARALYSYLCHNSIRLVHTFDWPTTPLGVCVARLAGVPVVLSSQRGHRDLTPQPYRTLVRITDSLVSGIVVNCEYIHRHLIEDEHWSAARIELCRNGVDTAVFTPRAERPPGPLVIGNISVLREEKGTPVLIEAFRRLQAQRPNCRLRIIGGGPLWAEVEKMRDGLGLGETFSLEPATQDVASRLREFDIFVLPSYSEALSNALMEAMAGGLPVVASDVGGNPELVDHGITGLLFQAGDSAGLAAALCRCFDDAALRERLGRAAAARMRAHFTIEQSATRMGEIYSRRLFDKLHPARERR